MPIDPVRSAGDGHAAVPGVETELAGDRRVIESLTIRPTIAVGRTSPGHRQAIHNS